MEATRQPPQRSEQRFIRPEERYVRPHSGVHRMFYRDDVIAVSDRWLTISDHRFAVAELYGLRTVREPQMSNRMVVMAGVTGFVMLAAVTMVASVAAAATIVAVPLLAVLVAGLLFVAMRLRRRHFTLYAEYRGRTVRVFGTQDERRYNQVCRALLRACEYHR
jgi:hypothetical protein